MKTKILDGKSYRKETERTGFEPAISALTERNCITSLSYFSSKRLVNRLNYDISSLLCHLPNGINEPTSQSGYLSVITARRLSGE